MALQYFSPAHPPTANQYQDSKTPRMLTADFGDGYVQSAPDGLNNMPSVLDISWNPIEIQDAAAIEAFLVANSGLAFYWTPPGETAFRKWSCTAYTRTKGVGWDIIQVTFSERFDLV